MGKASWPNGQKDNYFRTETVYTLPNPNPRNFKIKNFKEIGKYLVVKIHYPDCTNFEGMKVMVFADMTMIDLLQLNEIDPHFSKAKNSPIARFKPDDEGWGDACYLAEIKNN